MEQIERIAREHADVSRRYFLQFMATGVAGLGTTRLWAGEHENKTHSLLAEAISKLEYLAREEDFLMAGCRQSRASLTQPRVNRTAGQFSTRLSIGRHCFAPLVPENTTFAAAQSMLMTSLSPCHVHSSSQAITLFRKCKSLLKRGLRTCK